MTDRYTAGYEAGRAAAEAVCRGAVHRHRDIKNEAKVAGDHAKASVHRERGWAALTCMEEIAALRPPLEDGEAVERVAKAIFDAKNAKIRGASAPWEWQYKAHKDWHKELARAAIAAYTGKETDDEAR